MFKKNAALLIPGFAVAIISFVALFMFAQERWGWKSKPTVQAQTVEANLRSPEGDRLAVEGVYLHGSLLGVKTFKWGNFETFSDSNRVNVVIDENLDGTYVEVKLYRLAPKDIVEGTRAWWVKEMTLLVRTPELKKQWDSAIEKVGRLGGQPRDVAPPNN